MLTSLIYIASFVLVLSLIVVIHEGGHFLMARWCGVHVTDFSVGFGKEIFSLLFAKLFISRQNRGKGNILQYRHVIEEVKLLEYHTDVTAMLVDVYFKVGNILTAEVDRTACRVFHTV